MESARELGTAVFVVERFRDAWLAGQELTRMRRRQGQEGHDAPRRRARDGADERQMPDDVADPLLALYDDGRCHWLALRAIADAGPLSTRAAMGGQHGRATWAGNMGPQVAHPGMRPRAMPANSTSAIDAL